MHFIDYLLIVFYILLAFLFSYLGRKNKKFSQIKIFLISFFLTPITAAFLIYYKKKEISRYNVYRYKCESCGFKFDEEHVYCPICEKEGRKAKLQAVAQIMT